jgi:hypothetical protein
MCFVSDLASGFALGTTVAIAPTCIAAVLDALQNSSLHREARQKVQIHMSSHCSTADGFQRTQQRHIHHEV